MRQINRPFAKWLILFQLLLTIGIIGVSIILLGRFRNMPFISKAKKQVKKSI